MNTYKIRIIDGSTLTIEADYYSAEKYRVANFYSRETGLLHTVCDFFLIETVTS